MIKRLHRDHATESLTQVPGHEVSQVRNLQALVTASRRVGAQLWGTLRKTDPISVFMDDSLGHQMSSARDMDSRQSFWVVLLVGRVRRFGAVTTKQWCASVRALVSRFLKSWTKACVQAAKRLLTLRATCDQRKSVGICAA
jgi:hypothetical protein